MDYMLLQILPNWFWEINSLLKILVNCEEDMRKHLIKCLDNRIMTTFPKIFIGEENNDISTIENNEWPDITKYNVYCICRQIDPEADSPYMKELQHLDWVKCPKCNNWFHFNCLDIIDKKLVGDKNLKCPVC